MPDSLCVLFCQHHRAEAESVVATSSLPKVRVGTFPARCGRPCLSWEELEALRTRPGEPMVAFGGPCLGALDEEEARARGVSLHRLKTCMEMLLSPTLLEAFLGHGAYALTPGWLEDWQGRLAEQGQDPDLVREIWRESVTRLLLLDTGIGPSQERFQALCEHLGIPGEVVPLGLDHLQLLMEREVLEARLRLQTARSEGTLNEAQRQVADRATAIEFLGSLSQSLQEADVIRGIEDLFTMLFHARKVAFLPPEEEGAPPPIPAGRPYVELEDGFVVSIGASLGLAGYLRVEGLAFPRFQSHYMNLALSMAGVCALAIHNAQTYRAVEDSRAYQRLMLDVLDVFYQPRGSGGEVETALGFLKAYTRVDALALRLKRGGRFVYAHADGYTEAFTELECGRCLQAMTGQDGAPAGMMRTPRGSLWANHLPEGDAVCPCGAHGFRSVAKIQLLLHGGAQGFLQLHHRSPGHFNAALVERLEGVTRSIGIGMERRWAEEDLRWMNRELETRVRQRTTELAAINQELRLEIVERTRVEGHLEAQSAELQARLRQLHCLYALSNLFEQHQGTVDALCLQAIQMVPGGWNQPERTSARLRLDDREFCSSPFRESSWRLAAPIAINGTPRGFLEVFVNSEEGVPPFLDEEREFIRTMADLVQGLADHVEVEEEKRKIEQQLVQSQKLEAIGTLAGGIAHDFNNALTPIISLADLSLMSLPEGSPLRRHLELIKKSGDRAKGLVDQILLFSRRKAPDLQPLDLAPLLAEIMKLIRATLPSTIEIRQELGEGCGRVLGDPTQVHQIVMNLCTNAYHAMQERGGLLVLRLGPAHVAPEDSLCALGLAPGEYLQLEVADSGTGMDQEVQARIFEPFYTTKGAGKGTGMGLSVVHGIVSSYQGHISVHSEPGRGTTFRILLPRAGGGMQEAAGPGAAPAIPRGTERILIVDDEESIRLALSAMLGALGYRTVAVEGGPQALERLREDPEGFDLILTDMTMPKLTGLDLAHQVHLRLPGAPMVICSGFSDRLDPEHLEAAGIREFVQKPFAVAQVAQALRRELDRRI